LRKANPDFALAVTRKGMQQGIGEKLIDDQAAGNRCVNGEKNIFCINFQ
jgi:hypothetical protein